MKILVLGAAGFIGRHLVRTFADAGHEVVQGTRRPEGRTSSIVAVDFARMTEPAHWRPLVLGMDVVINCVGILRETADKAFDALHDAAPRALFEACQATGVRKVVQISALGADEEAQSRFHLSKKRADDFLSTLPIDWLIVQPSFVFGEDGASARLFARLAALPATPLPGDGRQWVQPIHVEDLSRLILHLVADLRWSRSRVAAVGPRPVTLREWLEVLRTQMGLGNSRFVRVPLAFVRMVIGGETLGMLLRGNTASAETAERALGRPPRDIREFVTPREGQLLALRSRLDWLLPLLRAAVALTWLVSGVVSLGFYPVRDSMELLARVGLQGMAATVALYGAAALDVLLGVAVYAFPGRRLWRAQLAVIAGYSALLTVFLPELWLHPFGPLLKNIPMAAAIVLLHELEERS